MVKRDALTLHRCLECLRGSDPKGKRPVTPRGCPRDVPNDRATCDLDVCGQCGGTIEEVIVHWRDPDEPCGRTRVDPDGACTWSVSMVDRTSLVWHRATCRAACVLGWSTQCSPACLIFSQRSRLASCGVLPVPTMPIPMEVKTVRRSPSTRSLAGRGNAAGLISSLLPWGMSKVQDA